MDYNKNEAIGTICKSVSEPTLDMEELEKENQKILEIINNLEYEGAPHIFTTEVATN